MQCDVSTLHKETTSSVPMHTYPKSGSPLSLVFAPLRLRLIFGVKALTYLSLPGSKPQRSPLARFAG